MNERQIRYLTEIVGIDLNDLEETSGGLIRLRNKRGRVKKKLLS